MSRVDRSSPEGRAFLDLQNHSRREGLVMQQVLTFYALERWLARLAASVHAEQFILKGGMLLAAVDARRPTVDADTMARGIPSNEEAIRKVVAEIAALSDPDGAGRDGIVFDTDSVKTRRIREEGLYAGVRVTFIAELATARTKVSLDVNFGDPITPGPQRVSLPSVRPGTPSVTVLGYPLETVLAEKIATAIELGEANTRMKDYSDIWTLTSRHTFSHAQVRSALLATAAHRGTVLEPLLVRVSDLVEVRAGAFTAYRRSLGADGAHLPDALGEVVAGVVAFADPLLLERPAGSCWHAATRTWD